MDDVTEIREDDLVAVTSAAILYMQVTGDTGIVDSLGRIGHVMAHNRDGEIKVVRAVGKMDPNIHARMRMAKMVVEMGDV